MTSPTQPPEPIPVRHRRHEIALVPMAFMAGGCGRSSGRSRHAITLLDGHACDPWRALRGWQGRRRAGRV